MPFVTIVRQPDIQVGTNQAGLYNIPGKRTYTYMKVPTWDGSRKGIDLYKVPQPTAVDITYEVRIFTNKMKDLNLFNSLIHTEFQSRQRYITVKGHPMPVHLENISDESNLEDLDGRRFYVQFYELKLLGYILNEDEFEVIPTINRVYTLIEIDERTSVRPTLKITNDTNCVTYTMIFKPLSDKGFNFIAKYDLNFTQLININNLTRIIISVNGVSIFDGTVMTTPIFINAGDDIGIRVFKDSSITGSFQLIGGTI